MEKVDFDAGQIILINKPLTWSSFQAVKKVKYATRAKIGHAGTLDPLASGLLILCTGKATKLISSIQQQTKEYTGTITLGGTTASYDLEKPVDAVYATTHITESMIYEQAQKFIGAIEQVPPIFSAIKQEGKPVYLKARKNKEVKLQPRQVQIYEFEITKIDMPVVHFRVTCSAGTYIRSLAHDFGKELQSGAHLSSLCRTKIGDYSVSDALTPNEWVEKYKSENDITPKVQ